MGGNLVRGLTVSCGCYRDDRIRETCGTLASQHPDEYKTWSGVKRRCLNPNEQAYAKYGAAGVTICNRWKDSFENFFADMGPRPTTKHTIDRIRNELGYQPGNCRWATRREQAQNTRKATALTYNGETKPTPDWARQFGIRLQTLHGRLAHGWSVERALTTPTATDAVITHDGHSRTIAEWSAVVGIRIGTIRHRLKHGWTVKDALSTPTA